MRGTLCALALLRVACGAEPAGNMNRGGVPYAISNPPGSTPGWRGTPGRYETDFHASVAGAPVEHFDVYGEVRTRYSEVYWTTNAPVRLPEALIARFNGKVMAITGYEIDQVVHPGPQPNTSTTGPDRLGGFACWPDDCDDGARDAPRRASSARRSLADDAEARSAFPPLLAEQATRRSRSTTRTTTTTSRGSRTTTRSSRSSTRRRRCSRSST